MNPTFPPTRRQADLLRFIVGYQEAHGGVSPTVRECMTGIGCKSIATTVNQMDGLEWRGLIRRLPRRARAIEVLRAPPIPRGPAGEPLFFVPFHGGEIENA